MKADFQAQLPGVYFLDHHDPAAVGAYLSTHGHIAPSESVAAAEKAGEGNMNCTVRVRLSSGATFIMKQARPWLEKYPQVAAPFDRTLLEGLFYQLVQDERGVSARMPRLLWLDEVNRVIALEDLGAAGDFFPLYRREIELDDTTLFALVDYLSALHAIPVTTTIAATLRNADMRALNHAHIFDLPLRQDNGFNLDELTPGLAAVGDKLKRDAKYCAIVAELGESYLHGTGESILHGDFFPGSFLRTPNGVHVIDPEFSFCGDPEFDLGVLAAHLFMAGEPPARVDQVLARYLPATAKKTGLRLALVRQYVGTEIMRRLLGLAQIPTLKIDLARKTELLDFSRRLVCKPEEDFRYLD